LPALLSLADGKEIWNHAYSVDLKRNHGMSRTVPAVTDKYVVSFGPKCDVLCVDTDSGEFRWGIDLVAAYGSTVPPWYAGNVRSSTAIVSFWRRAGSVDDRHRLRQRKDHLENPQSAGMENDPFVDRSPDRRRAEAICLLRSGGVVGVAAEDGRLLWQTSEWKVGMATVPTPVLVEDAPGAASARLFLSGGYGAGSAMLRVEKVESSESKGDATLREKVETGEAKGEATRPTTLLSPLSALPSRAASPTTLPSTWPLTCWRGLETEVLYRLPPAVFGCEQQTPSSIRVYLWCHSRRAVGLSRTRAWQAHVDQHREIWHRPHYDRRRSHLSGHDTAC